MQVYSLFRPIAAVSLVSLFIRLSSPFPATVLHLQTAHHAHRSAYHLRGTVSQLVPIHSRWTLVADCRLLVPRHRLAGLPLHAVTPSLRPCRTGPTFSHDGSKTRALVSFVLHQDADSGQFLSEACIRRNYRSSTCAPCHSHCLLFSGLPVPASTSCFLRDLYGASPPPVRESPSFHTVEVGIMVAQDPLYRSERAAFPHSALASGDDAKPPQGIGMTDPRGRQPVGNEALHPNP